MKCLIRLCTIAVFLLLTSTMTYAANWQWVTSNDKNGFFFDTEDIHYELKYYRSSSKPAADLEKITCWVKAVFTEESAADFARHSKNDRHYDLSHILYLYTFSLPDKTATVHEVAFYDNNGQLIESFSKTTSSKILPESHLEWIFKSVKEYARTHFDELLEHTYRK